MQVYQVKPVVGWRVMLAAIMVAILCVSALPSSVFAASSYAVQQSSAVAYVVQRGDTLSGIASAYGVSVQSLVNYNGLANPNRIYVGQTLYVPTRGGGNPAPTGCRLVHTVVRGDTLSFIARWYGTSLARLQSINGLANPNRIVVGQRLCIA